MENLADLENLELNFFSRLSEEHCNYFNNNKNINI